MHSIRVLIVVCHLQWFRHFVVMPHKCGVVNCNGNYNNDNKCRVFKLPRDPQDKDSGLAVFYIEKILPSIQINFTSVNDTSLLMLI